MRVHPFRALRPAPDVAARVGAPPYDVVSRREAAALAEGNPLSFLHVGRAEIDLPADVDPYDARVYAAARRNLEALVARSALVREERPSLYVYREVHRGRPQLGVVGCVHVDDYERGLIKKHERTRPDKEDDRTRHILAVGAHAEPVLLAYRGRPEIDRLAAGVTAGRPLFDVDGPDGDQHTVWPVPDPDPLVEAFAGVPCAYVADGHHRSASAWRAARERRAAGPGGAGAAEYDWFPAVLCPADQLVILPYNRLIRDLGGQSAADFLHALARLGRLVPDAGSAPGGPGAFGFYLERRWHLLELPPASIDRSDPVRGLDARLLEERVLEPLLGIADQRTDPRIDFVGGVHGPRALEARVDAGDAALGISMFPPTVEQLMAVADAGAIMPPKSTWFEPKLLSGLFIHPLE
jgi:uncharacterized protein (DUF1015 family)